MEPEEAGKPLQGKGVATAVVIPAGPRDDIADTLESVLHFVQRPRLIVIMNDTGRTTTDLLSERDPDIEVVRPPAHLPSGPKGALWVKLTRAYQVVLERRHWDVVVRMDADALVIGRGLAAEAARQFAADPSLGMLGAYRIGPHGNTRDWTPAADRLASETGWWGWRNPALRATLRMLADRAVANGYIPGAHALGTSLLSPRLLETWQRLGWLELDVLAQSKLSDDHVAGLLTFAAGFHTGEMSGPSDLMAVQWRGLPFSPEQLISEGKALVHSVRSFGELDEQEIRDYFRQARVDLG